MAGGVLTLDLRPPTLLFCHPLPLVRVPVILLANPLSSGQLVRNLNSKCNLNSSFPET